MRTRPVSALFLILTLAAVPLAAETGPPKVHELRAQMIPVYQNLQTDIEYLALAKGLEGNLENREVVDRYLDYLPMSPLLMLEIDMFLNRYEIVTPRIIAEWHQRWIVLHESKARKMYGDAYVDERLRRLGLTPAEGAVVGVPLKNTVGPNRNLAATFIPDPDDYQGEVQVVANPNDPDYVVAAANTWDNMGGACGNYGLQAVFYSSDGGVTWGYTCPPDDTAYGLSCAGGTFGSDPALYWNDADEVFLEYMLICYLGGSNYRYAIVVARSADGGVNWTPQGVVINSYATGALEDKNFYAIDNHSGSPYYGRHYTCWDRNNNEKSAWSSNNGVTWNEVDLPTTGGGGGRYDLGCELAVEDNGTVHVIYDTLSCGASCYNEEMFYSHSTNGGASWSTPVEVHDFNLVGFSGANCPDAQDDRCIGPMGALDVDNSGGACDGNLYAAFGDYTSGSNVDSTDIYVTRSTDGGATWATPVMVNDDGLAGRIQFHPFLWVDQANGNVIVVWHDARNHTDNTKIDYFLARSSDCGLTWETNIQVSQPSAEFNNSTISWSVLGTGVNPGANPNQFGEYMGLDIVDSTAYVAWTDTRHYYPDGTAPTATQLENIGFAKVDILPDVWSQDKPWDTGLEPDPATALNNMWESEDIWVRNDATPGPHQNPEAGQVNYVWVNVRNRSLLPAYNMPIEVWGTLASTGLSWPSDWTLLGTVTVPLVPAMGVVQATLPWTPAVQGHYCLLVRHDTAQDPLTYAETSSVNYNTRFNNNIVWRNVNIVDLISARVRKVWFYFRNISGTDLQHNLVFREAANRAFLDRGRVKVYLPDRLADIWHAHGTPGAGFNLIDPTTIEILDPRRSYINVPLDAGQEFRITMTFEDTAAITSAHLTIDRYLFLVEQEELGPNGVVGGVNYQISAPRP